MFDPAAAFEQDWEEEPDPHLRDRQVQVAGLRGHRLLAVAAAPGGAVLGVLARLRTDVRGGLRLDQFLQYPLHQSPDHLEDVAGT